MVINPQVSSRAQLPVTGNLRARIVAPGQTGNTNQIGSVANIGGQLLTAEHVITQGYQRNATSGGMQSRAVEVELMDQSGQVVDKVQGTATFNTNGHDLAVVKVSDPSKLQGVKETKLPTDTYDGGASKGVQPGTELTGGIAGNNSGGGRNNGTFKASVLERNAERGTFTFSINGGPFEKGASGGVLTNAQNEAVGLSNAKITNVSGSTNLKPGDGEALDLTDSNVRREIQQLIGSTANTVNNANKVGNDVNQTA